MRSSIKKIDHGTTKVEKLIAEISSEAKVESVDEKELEKIVERVLADNPQAVADYKSGKESAIMFLVGQCMRAIGRKVDAQQIKETLINQLAK